MQNRLFDLILFYPLFLFSLSFHEAAHGLIAEKYGDNTARLMGRVTLSPFPHMDMLGTVILPIIGILTGAPVIGWGKPVPVNPYRLKGDIRRSSLWVAAAGPISNVMLAVAFALAVRGLISMLPHLPDAWLIAGSSSAQTIKMIFTILQMGVVLNLVLAFFNMLPMPPLDGGTVIRGILPESSLHHFDKFSRYSFVILLVLLVTGLLRYILVPVFYVAGLLLP